MGLDFSATSETLFFIKCLFGINHPNMHQNYLKNHNILLSLKRSIDWYEYLMRSKNPIWLRNQLFLHPLNYSFKIVAIFIKMTFLAKKIARLIPQEK